MGVLNVIKSSIDDVNASSISFPALPDVSAEVFVGVGDAPIVLLLECVLRRARIWISTFPERCDEIVTLLVCRELLGGGTLLIGDDVQGVFIQEFSPSRDCHLLQGMLMLLDSPCSLLCGSNGNA